MVRCGCGGPPIPRYCHRPTGRSRIVRRTMSWYENRSSVNGRTSMHWSLGKRSLIISAVAVLGLFFTSVTSAQENYPTQNVKFVVAFPPGGPTDAIARIIGQRLTEKWGQSVV